MENNNNNTGAIILTAVISAVSAAALTAGIIFAIQNRDKIKATAIRVKDKSVAAAKNMKAKLAKKKDVEINVDEDYEIPEELGIEEAAADLEILTVEE
jgi:Rieske Fe-S protein